MKRTLNLIACALALTLTMMVALGLALPGRSEYRDAMTAANNLYQSGEYAAAAGIYEQILAQGNDADSAVHYNLGNAYFQLGDFPRALLSYEQAAELSPRDGDIRANLEAARALATSQAAADAGAADASSPLGELNARRNPLSLNELALLALAGWLAVGFFFLATRLIRERPLQVVARAALVAAVLLFLLSAATFGGRMYLDSRAPETPGGQAWLALEMHNEQN